MAQTVVTDACNPSAEETETGSQSLLDCQLTHISELQVQ